MHIFHFSGRFFLCLLALSGGAGYSQEDAPRLVDSRLFDFFQDHLEQTFKMRPFDATLLGDHRFDHLLDDVSPEARAAWLDHSREQLKILEQEFADAQFSENGRIDYQIFRDDLQRSIWLAENTKPFEQDPRTYGSYINDSVYSLLTQ
ncbi:MAG: DUF885 family protein, partial [Aureliella sp.]